MSAVHHHRFRFQVSDWTLFSVTRPLQVVGLGIEAPPSFELPPLSPQSQGILVRSMPMPEPSAVTRGSRGLLRYVLQRFPRHYIEMEGQDFEGYKQKFSGKTRSTLQRKVKRFAESCAGGLRWERFASAEELERFWALAREVSSKTYQEQLLDAGLPDDPAYRQQALALARDDRVRAFLLFDGDRPVSYLYCPIFDGVVLYAYLGYDPAYRHLSVGTVLQWLALESLFGEARYRFFDFTEGDGDHKRLFATASRDCINVALLRPSLFNRLLVATHGGFTRSIEGFGNWLDRKGWKARARRWLRHGAA